MVLMDMVRKIGRKPGCNFLRSDIKEIVKAYHDVLKEELAKGQTWSMPGIGIFRPKIREARKAFDTFNKTYIDVPRAVYPTFKFKREIKLEMRKNLSPDAGIYMLSPSSQLRAKGYIFERGRYRMMKPGQEAVVEKTE